MCTGDSIDTAIAISLEAGIITPEELSSNEEGFLCMEGKKFRNLVEGIRSISVQESGE